MSTIDQMATPKSDRLQLRISPDEKTLIEQAAAISGQTISEFVLANVRDAAFNKVVDRRLIELGEDDWTALNRRLEETPRVNEGLRRLLARPRPE